MNVTLFFKSIEQHAYAGFSWLYNNTIGTFSNYVGGAVLSGAEQFFADIMGAILALFGGILNYISSAIDSVLFGMVNLANSMGLWGPPLAILGIAAFTMVVYELTKTIVRLV